MKICDAITIGGLMDTANRAGDGADGSSAYFALVDIKQQLINRELYECLVGFYYLEKTHELKIPFKMKR